jgi:hypothetical protein
MAKQSGLGDNFYIGGYDLSGDVSSLDAISGGPALIDVTSIKKSANERIGGQRDGSMKFTTWFEFSSAVTNPGVPSSGTPYVSTYNFPVLVTITGGTGTQVNINGVNQGSFDGTYLLPALGTITLTYSVAPTWAWVGEGTEHNALSILPRTDTIGTYFRGTAVGSSVACINGKQLNYDFTRDNKGALSAQVEIDANGFGLEWGEQLTPGIRIDTTATTGTARDDGAGSTFGAQAYLQLIELQGTSVDVTITHCTTSGGSYTTLMDFGAQTAIGSFRQSVSNTTTVNEFLKVVTTGTFTYAAFAVAFMRNLTAGQVF